MSNFQGFPPNYSPVLGYPNNRRRAVFQVRKGDTLPPIEYTLDGNDMEAAHPNLAGASVKFIYTQLISGATPTIKTATVVDAESNRVKYQWLAGDTATVGDYLCEFEVTYADATKKTFPAAGPLTLEIIADLG
jgi:hypothetical protein